MAPVLRSSGVFPSMVAGMVDIGNQTGALPEILMKAADTYKGEVGSAVGPITFHIELIMIVVLAVIVGIIVIAMFMPLIAIMEKRFDNGGSGAE